MDPGSVGDATWEDRVLGFDRPVLVDGAELVAAVLAAVPTEVEPGDPDLPRGVMAFVSVPTAPRGADDTPGIGSPGRP